MKTRDAAAAPPPPPPDPPSEAYARELDALFAAREQRLRSASGWLALVGKFFLHDRVTPVGAAEEARLPDGAPPRVGTLTVDGDTVRFDATDGVLVTCNGEPVTSRVLRTDAHGAADVLVTSGLSLSIMQRGSSFALRVRDGRVLPRPFAGIVRLPVDAAWRKEARFVRHATPIMLDVELEGATDGPMHERATSPGRLVFSHGGTEHAMDAMLDDTGSRLYVPFRDATSGTETYGSGRFLYARLPDDAGKVVLDFNTAMLPGCAFSVYATCPVPPPGNRLPFAVRAGEAHYLPAPGTTSS